MLSPGRFVLVLVALAVLAVPTTAAAQEAQTFVAGLGGDDVNPCSQQAPCKTLAGAIAKTAENGRITAIDDGRFQNPQNGTGAFTITKGITIDGSGRANLFASNVSAIVVNAPGKDVVLNGINILGSDGATGCSSGSGIQLIDARSLTVTDVDIAGFGASAITLAPGSGNTSVEIDGLDARRGCGTGDGITVAPGGAFTASAMVDGVTLTNLDTGLSVADRGHAYLANSTIFGNTLGLQTLGTGIIDSLGGNHVAGNVTNGSPTTDVSNVGPAGPPGASGATGPQGAQGPQGVPGPAGAAGSLSGIRVKCRLVKHKRIKCTIKHVGAGRVTLRL